MAGRLLYITALPDPASISGARKHFFLPANLQEVEVPSISAGGAGKGFGTQNCAATVRGGVRTGLTNGELEPEQGLFQ